MVYLLPLYSPLRLIEEICMLDHLSYGRLEVGVGRGVSPFELNYHKIAHEDSREIFEDAYACLKAGLAGDTFSYAGKYFNYKDVPMPLRPLQQPSPAFWYGSSNTVGSTFAGEQGLHFSTNGPIARAKVNIDAYRTALAKRGERGAAEAGIPRRRRHRHFAQYCRRRHRRGSRTHCEARARASACQPQLSAQSQCRLRSGRAAQHPA